MPPSRITTQTDFLCAFHEWAQMNLNLSIMCPDTAQKDTVRAAVSRYELKIPGLEVPGILRSTNGLPKRVQYPSLKGSRAECVKMATKLSASHMLFPLPKPVHGPPSSTKAPDLDLCVYSQYWTCSHLSIQSKQGTGRPRGSTQTAGSLESPGRLHAISLPRDRI